MTTRKHDVGSIIRQAREERGLTLRQAAEALSMDWSYYRKIETGENPLGKYARPIAKLYRLNTEELEAKATAKLPAFAPYLRAKFDLSDEAVAELEAHFAAVSQQHPPKGRRRS